MSRRSREVGKGGVEAPKEVLNKGDDGRTELVGSSWCAFGRRMPTVVGASVKLASILSVGRRIYSSNIDWNNMLFE